jgi:hypothetical protein
MAKKITRVRRSWPPNGVSSENGSGPKFTALRAIARVEVASLIRIGETLTPWQPIAFEEPQIVINVTHRYENRWTINEVFAIVFYPREVFLRTL